MVSSIPPCEGPSDYAIDELGSKFASQQPAPKSEGTDVALDSTVSLFPLLPTRMRNGVVGALFHGG